MLCQATMAGLLSCKSKICKEGYHCPILPTMKHIHDDMHGIPKRESISSNLSLPLWLLTQATLVMSLTMLVKLHLQVYYNTNASYAYGGMIFNPKL